MNNPANVAVHSAPSIDPVSRRAVRRNVIRLGGPALVEMLLVTLVGMADTMMVGRLGPAAIAAVGLANAPMFLAIAVFTALNTGSTAVIARAIGAGDKELADDALRQSFMLTALLGVVVSVSWFLLARRVMILMGAASEVVAVGTTYMKVGAPGLMFMQLAMCVSAALRGAGNTMTSMKINVFCNVLHVIGNYLLIYGRLGFPAMGVAGAGWSTSISRVIAFVPLMWVVLNGRSVVHLRRPLRPNLPLLRRISRIGAPAALEQIILQGGQLAHIRIVAGLGTSAVASHQIATNILNLSFQPGMAFAISATTLVGQGLGAMRPDLAEEGAVETQRLGMVVSGMMALAFIVFARQIPVLFTDDPTVVLQTASVLRIIGLVQPAQAAQLILAGALRGAGDTKWPLYSAAVGFWGIRVLLGYVLAVVFQKGLVGAWLAMAIDQLVRSGIINLRFRSGKWKVTKI